MLPPMSDGQPWFYSIFGGQDHGECEAVLGPGAFTMSARDIVEHLDEAGYRPDILDPSREPLPTPGITVKLLHAGRTIAVSVNREWGHHQRPGDQGRALSRRMKVVVDMQPVKGWVMEACLLRPAGP